MNATKQEWMRFEEIHGKVHVIIRQFEQIFNRERDHAVRDRGILNLIQDYARTHLTDLLNAGAKSPNLQSYIQDERLRPFWRDLQRGYAAGDPEHSIENITPNN